MTRLAEARRRLHGAASVVVTGLGCLLVWFALVAPADSSRLTPGAFVRLPLEALVVVVLVLVVPARAGRVLTVLVGTVLGVLTIARLLDLGFLEVLDRPFDPLNDWTYLGPAVDLLGDSIGGNGALVASVVAGLLCLAVLIGTPLTVVWLSRRVERHPRASTRALLALGLAWSVCAALQVQVAPGVPVASTSAADLARDEVVRVRDGIRDRQEFAAAVTVDRFGDTPRERLLTGLQGKDVLVVFIESYGRVALEDPTLSPQVHAVLDAGTRQLREAGFSSRSGFLTSPTFGGTSWLAHSTLQSGLWVDNEHRYDFLVEQDRLTLSGAFDRAGWRTVGVVPANDGEWPEGTSLYEFDQVYDARNVGYAGPEFSYASMPDQYVLSTFHRLELADPDRAPVMAEIDLVSSHAPWTPLPHLVPWSSVGDGSVFDPMPDRGESPDDVWRDDERVRAAYADSIVYSLRTLVSFVHTYGDDDLVLVVLGDHQPTTVVTGSGASRDVPVTVIARDPAVVDRIAGWGWQRGLEPAADAPVWPMDTFRDRFLTAYGPRPQPTPPLIAVRGAD